MKSSYLYDLFTDTKKIIINKIKNYDKSKKYIIPNIGLLEHDKTYSLPKDIFISSRLFYCTSDIINIDNNINICFEGNAKFIHNKWYIKTTLDIINKYKNIFEISDIKIFIQIVQNKTDNICSEFCGGLASYNAIEFVSIKNFKKNYIKQIIAHEILHLFFPSIKSKNGTCYNEGVLDYLSCYLIFSEKGVKYYANQHITKYTDYKNINLEATKQHYPYIYGFFMGLLLKKEVIDQLLLFIKKYVKERKYMLIPWNNTKYIKFIKENDFINKKCEQYIMYNV
jgi:hypothetical protein